MPRGRKGGFSPKRIVGLALSDQAEAARLGNVALTRGAKLAKKIVGARLMKNQTDLATAAGELAEAIKSDPAVVREMAEFAGSKGGDPGWSIAAHYLLLFETVRQAVRTGDDTTLRSMADVPGFLVLVEPMKRHLQGDPDYRPTKDDVWQHLIDQMDADAPDGKTVDRMMKVFSR